MSESTWVGSLSRQTPGGGQSQNRSEGRDDRETEAGDDWEGEV